MISAGRVLLMPKGDYDPTATYEMLDIVSYNGSSYIAKSTTTGNLPTNTTYWQLSAYGGQASNLAGNFAPLETTEYATRAYVADDIFVDKDSQLVIATTTINIGDEIEIGSNCNLTTMAELLDAIENRYDALDQRNRKLVGINPITIQTDLHLLAPGEYFKKLTNIYVTNAPTGINQIPSAVFRLTVEAGLDESGTSLLLTLRTLEGETYTQAYDGSDWSNWVEVTNKAYVDNQISSLGTAATKDSTNAVTSGSTDLVESGAVYTEITSLDTDKQDKTDNTLDTTSKSVVGAINEVNTNKADKTQISNPNLLDNPWFTVNQRGQSSYIGNSSIKQYTFDRWYFKYVGDTKSLTKNSDGSITFASTSEGTNHQFSQRFETIPSDCDITLSIDVVSYTGNNIQVFLALDISPYTSFVTFTVSKTGINSKTVKLPDLSSYNPSDIKVSVKIDGNNSITFRSLKLEKGSVSTLAMDTAPNYATELLKCQRYFQRIKQKSGASKPFLFACITNNYIDGDLSLPVPMRNIPTVTLNNCTTQIPSKTNISLSSVEGLSMANNLLYLYIPATGVTVGEVGYLRIGPDGYIDLSADL